MDGDAQPDMIASYKPGDFDGPVPKARPLSEAPPGRFPTGDFNGVPSKLELLAPAILRQVK